MFTGKSNPSFVGQPEAVEKAQIAWISSRVSTARRKRFILGCRSSRSSLSSCRRTFHQRHLATLQGRDGLGNHGFSRVSEISASNQELPHGRPKGCACIAEWN